MSKKKKQKSDGGYYINDNMLQYSMNLPMQYGHRMDKCQWCLAYTQGREAQPCPDRQQMELALC